MNAVAEDKTLLLVEDDRPLRERLARAMEARGFTVAQAETVAEGKAKARETPPAYAVVDLKLDDGNGLDVVETLHTIRPESRVVVLTGFGNIATAVAAVKYGAIDFLLKPFREQDLLDAIRIGIERDRRRRKERKSLAFLRSQFDALTSREREIMEMVSHGLPNKQIAAELGLSEVTVKVHRGHVMQKMGAKSLAELVRLNDRLVSTSNPVASADTKAWKTCSLV